MTKNRICAASSLLSTCTLSVLLTGCTLQTTASLSADTTIVSGTSISGSVHGGNQPITGAKVYLLAVNPAGYGGPGIAPSAANASVSLLNPTTTGNATDSIGSYVLTNANGGFNLAGDFACSTGYAQGTTTSQQPYSTNQTAGTEQVYLYVFGGNGAQTLGLNNPASGLLTALGSCNSPTLKIAINEVTTIATAYAFAGFASDATHIGSSGSALAVTGLSNAFTTVANLTSVGTGAAATASVGGNGTPPTATVITLASILAACVNSNGTTSTCSTLFQYAASAGASGTAASDTATAAINLAHNPYPTAAGVTALYGLIPSIGAPFAGSLTAAPNDFTLGIKFTGGGISGPDAIAIDASGNVWTANQGNSSVSELASTGTAISGSSGFTGGGASRPFGIAVDASGNIWTANTGNNSVSKFSSNGSAISGSSGFTGGGTSLPFGIAVDASGNIWTANGGNNSVTKLSNNGTAISGSNGFTGSGISYPQGIAIDASNNVWTANYPGNFSELANNGTAISGSNGFTGGGITYPEGIAIDPTGNVWTANYYNSSVSELSSVGTAISGSGGFTGGGLANPQGIAIDASGNVWIPNSTNNSVSKLSSTGTAISGSSGFTGGAPNRPYGNAIDGAGNLWIANNGDASVTELIGAASPVVTPLAANLSAPYGTSTINRP